MAVGAETSKLYDQAKRTSPTPSKRDSTDADCLVVCRLSSTPIGRSGALACLVDLPNHCRVTVQPLSVNSCSARRTRIGASMYFNRIPDLS